MKEAFRLLSGEITELCYFLYRIAKRRASLEDVLN